MQFADGLLSMREVVEHGSVFVNEKRQIQQLVVYDYTDFFDKAFQ